MELIAAIIAAIVGWGHGRLGARELKGVAVVVGGWTAVTTIAAIPYISAEGIVLDLAWRALIVGGAYALGVLGRRLFGKR